VALDPEEWDEPEEECEDTSPDEEPDEEGEDAEKPPELPPLLPGWRSAAPDEPPPDESPPRGTAPASTGAAASVSTIVRANCRSFMAPSSSGKPNGLQSQYKQAACRRKHWI
jgi:hypothetical protein